MLEQNHFLVISSVCQNSDKKTRNKLLAVLVHIDATVVANVQLWKIV